MLESSKNAISNEVVELTDDNFESVVMESKDIWFVYAYASWCEPCKAL